MYVVCILCIELVRSMNKVKTTLSYYYFTSKSMHIAYELVLEQIISYYYTTLVRARRVYTRQYYSIIYLLGTHRNLPNLRCIAERSSRELSILHVKFAICMVFMHTLARLGRVLASSRSMDDNITSRIYVHIATKVARVHTHTLHTYCTSCMYYAQYTCVYAYSMLSTSYQQNTEVCIRTSQSMLTVVRVVRVVRPSN